jgi:hypothetical protein
MIERNIKAHHWVKAVTSGSTKDVEETRGAAVPLMFFRVQF